ncbi:hypothetical protein T492DRAFT_862405, partial [Pavlovales sp. CCMP2436]
ARAALAGALAVLAGDSTLHRPALPATLNGSATAAASVGGKAPRSPSHYSCSNARTLLAEATEHARLVQMAHE